MAVSELINSRRVDIRGNRIYVYTVWYGLASDFGAGAGGWEVTGAPADGESLSIASMTFSGWTTPICVGLAKTPRVTKSSGTITATYVGERTFA